MIVRDSSPARKVDDEMERDGERGVCPKKEMEEGADVRLNCRQRLSRLWKISKVSLVLYLYLGLSRVLISMPIHRTKLIEYIVSKQPI